MVFLQHNRPKNLSNSEEKKQNKGYYIRRSRSFKVIEVGTNRNPVCNLLVINSN